MAEGAEDRLQGDPDPEEGPGPVRPGAAAEREPDPVPPRAVAKKKKKHIVQKDQIAIPSATEIISVAPNNQSQNATLWEKKLLLCPCMVSSQNCLFPLHFETWR